MLSSIDPTKPDELLDLQDYAKKVGVSRGTAWRWCRIGIRGRKLICLVIGGKLKTSKAALAEFIAATQPGAAQ